MAYLWVQCRSVVVACELLQSGSLTA
jgi:hypothetical protein